MPRNLTGEPLTMQSSGSPSQYFVICLALKVKKTKKETRNFYFLQNERSIYQNMCKICYLISELLLGNSKKFATLLSCKATNNRENCIPGALGCDGMTEECQCIPS